MIEKRPVLTAGSRRLSRSHLFQRILSTLFAFVLMATLVTNAQGSGFIVLLMSARSDGSDANFQSDYASVAYGGDNPLDPYPQMAFSSLSTDLMPDDYDSVGMIEGDGSPAQQQYDIFMHDEVAHRTVLLSKTMGAGQDGESVLASIGVGDPNLIAFQSSATNLRGDPDTNGYTDIYMVDLKHLDGDPILISVNVAGTQGGDDNSGNTLNNGLTWKTVGNTLVQISDWHKPAAPFTAYVDNTQHRFVAFESRATDLTVQGYNQARRRQIFLRDVTGGSTTLLSRSLLTGGLAGEGNGDSWQPSVSSVTLEEGRFVVFVSKATNLVDLDGDGDIDATDEGMYPIYPDPNDPTGPLVSMNIFLLDRGTNTMTLISRAWDCAAGVCTPGDISDGPSTFPSFSQDGKYIVFQSGGSNLVANDANGSLTDIFMYDTLSNTRRMRLVSVASDIPGNPTEEDPDPDDIPGEQGNLPSYSPVIVSSEHGAQVIVYTSYATNLIDGDTNENCNLIVEEQPTHNCPDVFVYDFIRNQTWRVSLTQDGQESAGNSGWPTLSGNGRFVYFTSIARLLSNGEYTGRREIFLRDQGNPPGNPNIQPTSWRFPDINVLDPVNHTSEPRRFRIVALAPITVRGLSLASGNDFTITSDTCLNGQPSRLLNSGDECLFEVVFNPKSGGDLSDRVLIDLKDDNVGLGDRIVQVHLRGRGYGLVYLPLIFYNK